MMTPIIPNEWSVEERARLTTLLANCEKFFEQITTTDLVPTQRTEEDRDYTSTTVAVKPSGTYTTTTHWGAKETTRYEKTKQPYSDYLRQCQMLNEYVTE